MCNIWKFNIVTNADFCKELGTIWKAIINLLLVFFSFKIYYIENLKNCSVTLSTLDINKNKLF